jgi:serine/threonine protein kinase
MPEAARTSAADGDRGPHLDFPVPEGVDDAIPAGTIIVDRYRVLATLGAGGMGTVYLGEHLTVGRRVAIKVLSGEWSAQSFVARRFQAEARIASAIGHPNIVEVFDAGQLPDDRLFLVMEHLEGHDLAEELLRGGRFSQLRTAEVLRQVALGLAAAHKLGVIHRDLKPGNVMIARRADGEVVKILDFGIACSPRATAREGQRLTLPGSVMGTPDYMAPEQSTSAEPTPRFDIYALGVMAFEMLSGRPPLTADDAHELLVRKRQQPSPSLATLAPHVAAEFVALIDDCLQILPAHRPLDASEFLERLDAFIAALPADERPARSFTAVSAAALATRTSTLDPESDPEFFAPRRPLPGPPTLPALSGAAGASRRMWLGLGLGVLTLGLGAWLLLSRPDRAAPPRLVETATPDAPRSLPEPVPPESTPPARPPDLAGSVPSAPDPPVLAPDPPIIAAPTVATPATARPGPGKREFASGECTRIRGRADEARRNQSWSLLRELSRRRSCWPTDAAARKLQTKALMELGDFTGCIAAGQGLDDKEVVQWRKLCQRRAG